MVPLWVTRLHKISCSNARVLLEWQRSESHGLSFQVAEVFDPLSILSNFFWHLEICLHGCLLVDLQSQMSHFSFQKTEKKDPIFQRYVFFMGAQIPGSLLLIMITGVQRVRTQHQEFFVLSRILS